MTEDMEFECVEGVEPSFDDFESAIIEQVELRESNGQTKEEIWEALRRTHRRAEDLQIAKIALEKYECLKQTVKHVNITGAHVSVEDVGGGWYRGESKNDRFWPALREHLSAQDKWAGAVQSIDHSSNLVTSLLADPRADESRVRGLVVGYVQSGKTANFTATIAKAADKGYKLFIVLSGIHNSLRAQTQSRMDEHLDSLLPKNWEFLTDTENDFGRQLAVAGLMNPLMRTLVVVKKNKSRLNHLKTWLEFARDRGQLDRCPVLIIDDEADQASVNGARNALYGERAKINELIEDIAMIPRRCTYVGYTATPFANVLMNASTSSTLYPRDFMYALSKPDGYFGAADIFKADLADPNEDSDPINIGIVNFVGDKELESMENGPDISDPDQYTGLAAAVKWFVLATAARMFRQQDDNSSMLIHTSAKVADHQTVKDFVSAELLPKLRTSWVAGSSSQLEWKKFWEDESLKEDSSLHGLQKVSFEELESFVDDVFDLLEVKMDNYRSEDRLEYPEGKQTIVIAIGGNTLSRGLTLEGLVCSYFARNARSYDALLQMGRWFGYRAGYSDLVRVWTTADLWSNFRFLSLVEEDVRSEIKGYAQENISPSQVAPRIRTHPSLTVTGKNKLQFAVESNATFGGRHPQTTYFSNKNAKLLKENAEAAHALLSHCNTASSKTRQSNHFVFHDIEWSAIRQFLKSYSIHESSNMTSDGLIEYVEQQVNLGELNRWNVAIVSKKHQANDKTIDLGIGEDITCINRSKLTNSSTEETACIGTLMSRLPDRVLDIVDSPKKAPDSVIQKARDDDGRALLVIYPIDSGSEPDASRQKNRTKLDANHHVIGVGFAFPNSHPDTPFGNGHITLDDSYMTFEDEDIAAIRGETDTEGDFEITDEQENHGVSK